MTIKFFDSEKDYNDYVIVKQPIIEGIYRADNVVMIMVSD
jgi:hypothetical protein